MNTVGRIILGITFLFLNIKCKTPTSGLEVENETETLELLSEAKIESETKIRYIEMYESICCPRDYKHDNHLLGYIKKFEAENNIILTANFKLQLGKEGEAAYFLSLENLSFKQQEKFINERSGAIKSDDKSVINNLGSPVTIKKSLELWDNLSFNNLIKF